jgi:signal transduction histidine kinase
MALFAYFESRIRPTAAPGTPPPQGLIAFYWHYIGQARTLFGAMFFTGLLVAFLGRAARLLRARDRHLAEQRERQLRDDSVLGLGALAAGTALELNTPLNTLGLLVEEWKAAGAPPDPEDLALASAIIAMAHSLGMQVIAEGVETEAQRQALVRHGCDELQGFLLGRPQPLGKLAHETSAATEPA